MQNLFEAFFLAFIPLFFAVDAVGVLPIYLSLTEDTEKKDKIRILVVSVLTAIVISVAFLFLGKLLFGFLGITISDFMIAGGIILFAIALTDLITQNKLTRLPGGDFGAVPLGTPLIAGPAVLTTSLLLNDQLGTRFGVVPGTVVTLIAIVANIGIAGVIFLLSDFVIRFMGHAGTRAMSKVSHLLLAAIAVMLVRKGIMLSMGSLP